METIDIQETIILPITSTRKILCYLEKIVKPLWFAKKEVNIISDIKEAALEIFFEQKVNLQPLSSGVIWKNGNNLYQQPDMVYQRTHNATAFNSTVNEWFNKIYIKPFILVLEASFKWKDARESFLIKDSNVEAHIFLLSPYSNESRIRGKIL